MSKQILRNPVPPDVLVGNELGTKSHAATATKLSVRSIENLVRKKAIPIIRISPRSVRFHLPSVLAALRRFEVQPIPGYGGDHREARRSMSKKGEV